MLAYSALSYSILTTTSRECAYKLMGKALNFMIQSRGNAPWDVAANILCAYFGNLSQDDKGQMALVQLHRAIDVINNEGEMSFGAPYGETLMRELRRLNLQANIPGLWTMPGIGAGGNLYERLIDLVGTALILLKALVEAKARMVLLGRCC